MLHARDTRLPLNLSNNHFSQVEWSFPTLNANNIPNLFGDPVCMCIIDEATCCPQLFANKLLHEWLRGWRLNMKWWQLHKKLQTTMPCSFESFYLKSDHRLRHALVLYSAYGSVEYKVLHLSKYKCCQNSVIEVMCWLWTENFYSSSIAEWSFPTLNANNIPNLLGDPVCMCIIDEATCCPQLFANKLLHEWLRGWRLNMKWWQLHKKLQTTMPCSFESFYLKSD